jgi:pilus assembly protein Flp/PilA
MTTMKTVKVAMLARRFLHDDVGATAIEYAMIASGIAIAIATTIVSLGSTVNGLYSSVATAMK